MKLFVSLLSFALAFTLVTEAATPRVFNGSGAIFARPNGTSFTWTYGSATTPQPGFPGTYPITQISYHNVGAPINWTLTRGHFEFSTNSGGSWSTYVHGTAGSTNFTTVAGKIWRWVDTSSNTTTSENVGFAYFLSGGPSSNVGTGSVVIPDNAPTDITSSVAVVLSTAVNTDTVALLTPTDTGDTTRGFWAIDSQSVPNLFTISFDNSTGNTASLKLGSGTLPAIGQTATVTARYYDTFQTDTAGAPIGGSGFSKLLTYTVVAGSSNALTLGNEIAVNTYTTDDQSAPSVAQLSTGGLAVVWQSAGQGGKTNNTKHGIYGQLLSSAGVKVGSEFVVSNAGASVDEIAPAVTGLNAGRFAVAYSTAGADADIAFRLVAADGTAGSQFIANSTTAGGQYLPRMATLTDGSFVIIWSSDNGDVRLRQFNATTGAAIAAEVLIADGATAGGYYPVVAALSNGGYATAWVNSSDSVVKTRVNGGSVVSTGIPSSGYAPPALAGLVGGGYVLASESYNSGTNLSDVEAARYNNSGVLQGSKFTAHTLSGGNRYGASVAALTGGGFIIGWSSEQDDFQQRGIMGRRFGATGTAVDTADFQINQFRADDQNAVALAPLAGDLFAAVWTDIPSASITAGTYIGNIEARVLQPAVVTAPEIEVTETVAGNIPDNTGTFSFGTTTVGTPVTKTFTVTNSGTATLNLSALSVPSGFTITQNFGSSTVAASGGTTTVQITMNAGAAATPSGTLQFTNDDSDENPYNFTISGTVNPLPTNVTINVPTGIGFTFNGTSYTGSQTVPVAPGTYTLSTTTPQSLGAGSRAVFSSWSDAGAISHSVTVGSSPITITGTFTTQYQLTTAASPSNGGTVTPASGTFYDSGTVVNVTATAGPGYAFSNWTSAVASASSASTTVTLDAAKSITANFVLAVPEIAISGNGNNIPDGSLLAAASTTNGTDFGSTPVQGGVVEVTYTITNSGTAALALSGGPSFVSVSPTTDFSVTQQPTSPVAANGGTTTFKIAFNPTTAATTSATVTFTNNDSDEASYDFVVKGTGTPARTFDLVGNAISNTPFDGGETYIYTPSSGSDIPVTISGGSLTINATGAPGAADMTISLDITTPGGPYVVLHDAGRTIGAPAGGTQVDPNTVLIPFSSITGGLTINGSPQADTFTFDFGNGDLLPPGGLTVNGGLPTTAPGDAIVVSGSFTDVTYDATSPGAGTLDILGFGSISFTGLEPIDLSGATLTLLTINVDPGVGFGNIITTIAAVDAGVNTDISFGSSGLESVKIGALTDALVINGGDQQDYYLLTGVGSAMTGDFTIDGKGGDADVIEVPTTATVTLNGVDKTNTLRADFIGVGRDTTTLTTRGILNVKGPLTLEANGTFNNASTTPIWGATGGIWGTSVPAQFQSGTFNLSQRGCIVIRGEVNKTGGADATLTVKATAGISLAGTGGTLNAVGTGGRIVSSSNKANIVLNADSDADNVGNVQIGGSGALTSNGGNITIGGGAAPLTTPARGFLAGTFFSSGFFMATASIDSGGGDISIRGQGMATSFASQGNGLLIAGVGNTLSSGAGSLTLVGTATVGTSGAGHGIFLQGTGTGTNSFSSTTGAISVTGTGAALSASHGVNFTGTATAPFTITTTDGAVTLNGTALAGGINHGIQLTTNANVTATGTGTVAVTGSTAGTGTGIRLAPAASTTSGFTTAGGSITLTADTMNLNGGAGTETISTGSSTAGSVTLKPLSAGKAIALGGGEADSASQLGIDTNTELPVVTAGTLNIGDATSGSLGVTATISPSTFTTLGLASGTGTTFNPGSGFLADVTSASNYEKIVVTGLITIAPIGVNFSATSAGGYIWNGTDTFVFLDNDGSDAISGTFTGPTLSNFLGSTLTTTQSYSAGTGNDFGTGIAVSNNANLANLELKTGTTTHTLTPVFASGTTSYTLNLPNDMFAVKIRSTVADPAATQELRVNDGFFTTLSSNGFFSGDLNLNTGSNTVVVRVTAGDTVTQKTYTVTITRAPLSPLFLGNPGSTGGGTGGGTIDAPNSDATGSLGKWESIRQGAVLSNSGSLAFRGHMEVGTGGVTNDNFQGIWKYDTVDTRLKARSGFAAPEAGGAVFDMLALNPSISPSGFISFYGTLRLNSGIPNVTGANNLGLWSELGGGALRLVLRKGDNVPGTSVAKTFRSGFAVATSSADTLALNARLSSGTALLHLDVSTPVTAVTVVAEEGQAAPGGGTWATLDGNSSDPRLSAGGDMGFIGWELVGTSFVQGIYSRFAGTPSGTAGVNLIARAGSTAPNTGGATFSAFERPTVFDGGMAFRGFLNRDGDNAAGTKGQGIWYVDPFSIAPVIRTGDGNAEVNTIPVGSTVTSVWSPFSNAQNTIAYRVGLSDGITETRAIMYTSTLRTAVIAKAGDAAPGLPGETFTNFDHPVIGDRDQIAFTAMTNAGTYGLWRRGLESGGFRLVLKVGDSINTSEGNKVISGISLPGITSDDRKFEAVSIDDNGNILVHITFSDGTTSLLLGQ